MDIADDLDNEWGVDILIPDETNAVDGCMKTMKRKLQKLTSSNRFICESFNMSGSSATVNAIANACDGNMDTCLIACGSYVSGDSGGFQSWSTSAWSKELCTIDINFKKMKTIAKSRTIPLPYHLIAIDDDAQDEYENKCLDLLQTMIIEAILNCNPFKAILLETYLAGCGATLHDEFLRKLGLLCVKYNITIIVDEIMTSVRMRYFLDTEQRPIEFIDAVSFVTVGKWSLVEVVFKNRTNKFIESLNKTTKGLVNRGASYEFNLAFIEHRIDAAAVTMSLANTRRELVQKFLNVKECDCWGKGAFLFCHVSKYDSKLNF